MDSKTSFNPAALELYSKEDKEFLTELESDLEYLEEIIADGSYDFEEDALLVLLGVPVKQWYS